MKSLVGDLIALRLPATTEGPFNDRLYRVLREAILDGSLPPGTRLPSSRDLGRALQMARNTVLHAYAQLTAEGYVRAAVGSGTYVAEGAPETAAPAPRASERSVPAEDNRALSQRGRRLLDDARASPHQWGAFMPGVPDVTRLPFERLARLFRDAWRTPSPQVLSYAYGGGLPALKRALAQYLVVSRSVDCDPEQIVVTEGVHQAIDLISRMLADVGDTVWVEDPGYWGARNTLRTNGLTLQGMPVDADGMVLPETEPEQAPRLIFLTPAHQYPLGSVMSLARRLQMVARARQWGSWIVEDDYDSEMRFAGRPIPAMQGLDPDAPVIYVGTFSKTLYPGLRLSYLVLPPRLVNAFQRAQAELYREGHFMTQTAIANFIEAGDYARHVRRMRQLYAGRRAMLVQLIERRLGAGWLHENGSDAGLHLVLDFPGKVDDRAVEREAFAQGVLTRALSRYYLDPARASSGLLLGYACVQESEMAGRFEAVVSAIAGQLRSPR